MSLNSAIYTGSLHHRRLKPRYHDFKYNVTFYYLDLSEIEKIFKIPFLFGSRRPLLFGYNRSDYLAGQESLQATVQDLIFKKTGKSHSGPVRMLTQITYFGFCFNPVTFFYCFDESNTHLQFIVAEITNTPWNERKSYVFECSPEADKYEFQFKKDFHVSPFFPMNLHYIWKFKQPQPENLDSRLNVFMEDWDEEQKNIIFFAHLSLKPQPLNNWTVFRNLLSYPFMTMKTVAAIYFQAFILLIKRIPFYSHPKIKGPPHGDSNEIRKN